MATAKKSKTTLDKFELNYEDTKNAKAPKKIRTTKKAVVGNNNNNKSSGNNRLSFSRFKNFYNNILGNLRKKKHPRKKTKKDEEFAKNQRNRGILGVGQLLVVVSIAYSTAVVFIGVDSQASRVALLPQTIFGLITLIKAFSKLYK